MLGKLFVSQVRNYPDQMAVKTKEKEFTYNQLNQFVNQISHAILKDENLNEETRHAALLFEHGPDMIAAIMGSLKTGTVYIPILPSYPEERLLYILENAEVNLIITNQQNLALAEGLQEISINTMSIINLDEIDQFPSDEVDLSIPEDQIAYILYTSGSTGRPKGVVQTHENIHYFITQYSKNFLITSKDRLTLFSAFTHDAAIPDIFGALLNGATVYLLNIKDQVNIQNLADWLRDEKITIWHSVPTVYRYFIKTLDGNQRFSDLRYVVLGGEEVLNHDIVQFKNLFQANTTFAMIYGQTESTYNATNFFTADVFSEKVTLGETVDDTELLIINEEGREVAPLRIGEIVVVSEHVALGYWNDPELTKHSFGESPNLGRFYYTGDQGRLMLDGTVEFVGRLDSQYKVRGYRVELGEVESKLLDNERVKEAAVIVKMDEEGETVLCAFVVEKSQITKDELRDFLAKNLPDYMIPTFFTFLDHLPVTTTFKLDRQALQELEISMDTDVEYKQPTTEIEKQLTKIWSDLLKIEKIGVNDDFFMLGGNSLKVTSLTQEIYKKFNVNLSLRIIFEKPTIQELAEWIEGAERESYCFIERVNKREYYPLSSAQKRLYILDQLNEENTIYNMPNVVQINGHLERDSFERSIRDIVKRHETLRTLFTVHDEEPVQVICDDVELSIQYFSGEVDVEKIIQEFIQPFDLNRAPLFRVGLIELADNQYLFIYDLHHIISDGKSMNLLVNEFIKLYTGTELQELPIQYKDYAVWQNRVLKSEQIQQQETYWVERFSDEIPVLNLATDFSRPTEMQSFGDRHQFRIDQKLMEALKNVASENGATLYMTLLAVYNILLAKYSRQHDIIVGSPIAGRESADLQQLIGMFVNTLAMRNYPMDNLSFVQFLAAVKENALNAYENQDYQFEVLVEKLELERNLNRNPLFDVMFVLQNNTQVQEELEDLSFEPYDLNNKVAKFDLILSAVEVENEVQMAFEYSTELFTKETIQRMAFHLQRIITSVIADPEVKLAEIAMLTENEKEKILYSFNQTAISYPKEKTIPQLFKEQVQRVPDQTAIVFGKERLSYHELNKRANQLARVLHSLGVGREKIVGIIANSSLEMIVGLLAIVKAGGAYLPIELNDPVERVDFMLEDADVEVLLIQKGWDNKIQFGGKKVILDDGTLDHCDGSDLSNQNHPHDLIYIMYTSGSTGTPKGVMIEHQNVNRLISNSNMLIIEEDERILQTGSLAFDASTFEIWGSLLNGATLYLTNKDHLLSPAAFEKALKENKISMIFLTAALFNRMVEENPAIFSELKTLYVGGDRLSPAHIHVIRKMNPNLKLVNGYGPTESTTFATYFIVDKEYEDIPIGKPLSNTRVYIIDSHQMLQPIGVPGELCIGGDGLARGYLNQPELTEEKFIFYPKIHGERIYKSGDLARWLPDGNIQFMGRMDQQVKIRGFRVEPGEVEVLIRRYNPLKEIAVISNQDKNGDTYLTVYFTAERKLKSSKIRVNLKDKLPEYMIPTHFIQLDQLPLNRNGKLDRKALPKQEGESLRERELIPPSSELEERLIQIWSEILEIEKIGVCDNFFEIGGHSLNATQLISRISKTLNLHLSLKMIFAHPTVRELAQVVKDFETNVYSSIEPVAKADYYPVSSAQKRLQVIDQLEGANIGYNVPEAWFIKGALDISRLEIAFQELVHRHEALRTSFHIIDGEMVQKIHKDVPFQISYRDWQGQTCKDVSVGEVFSHFIQPFDLSEPPLLRVGLVKFADQYLLITDMHHIISDGVSMKILLSEFSQLYQGERLPKLRIQYKDFAIWQNQFLASEKIRKQEKYWLDQFAGEIPVLNMRTDFPRPAYQSYEGETIYFELDENLTHQLNIFATENGATLYMVLLSILNILLAKYSGQDDIIIGSPIAGRNHDDLENIIGIFINTIAMRNYPTKEKRFIDFVKEVRENTLDAYENQDYQFEMLVEKVEIQRDLSRNPLFDILFVLHNEKGRPITISDMEFCPFVYDQAKAKVDLTISTDEIAGKQHFLLNYRKSLFNKETMQRFATHFVNLIREGIENPDLTISGLEMISTDERNEILGLFNHTEVEYPDNKTLHQLFEDQVEKRGDQIALIFEDQPMTYNELNKKANQLAHSLIESGVQSDAIVGLMVKRSLDLVVGLLGILKSGGAYLPIDPEFPEERIEYMLTDSQASILVSEEDLMTKVNFAGELLEIQSLYHGQTENPSIGSSPKDLAYIIYTSGSTGKPKGVMIEHRNIVNYTWWKIKAYQITPEDITLQLLSYSFDGFGGVLYPALGSGGKLIFLEENHSKDFPNMKALIREEKVTNMGIAPFMWKAMIENASREDFASVRFVTLAGEKTGEDLLQLHAKVCPNVQLVNEYGPTEGTIASTAYFDMQPDQPALIGKPIYNRKVYIMDESDHLLPVGIPGELCIAGTGLAKGYLHQPELTAEKFVPDPFGADQYLYRTGDLAQWLPDGNIEFLGRIDSQVKIRGFRIELQEIEGVLLDHPDVKEVIVLDREANGRKVLCAYLIFQNDGSVSYIREYLGKKLPDYMIPAHFIEMGQFPLMGNGKVNLKKLPEPDGQRNLAIEYVAASSEMESILAEVWSDVLNLNQVGVKDNFFSLGGDSITAIQISSRLQKYQLKLELKDLFEYPTIEELASKVKQIKTLAEQDVIEGEVNLTPIQHWFFDEAFSNPEHHNQSMMLFSESGFDQQILCQVLKKICKHHDALRMVYQFGSGEFDYNIAKKKEFLQINRGIDGELFTFKVHNLVAESDPEEKINELANQLQRSFDLMHGPLITAELYQTQTGDHLLIVIHHLVVDGVSWRIILEDLAVGYKQVKNSEEIRFQLKTDSYQKWSAELLKFANSEQFLSEINYWKEIVEAEIPPLKDQKLVEKDTRDCGADVQMVLAPEWTESLLRNVNHAYNTEVNDILITAVVRSVQEWTGEDQVALTLEGHGREEIIEGIDLTRTVGWFTSMYPVFFPKLERDDLSYQLKMIKERLRSVPNKGVGYGVLKYITNQQFTDSIQFQLNPEISFNYFGQIDQNLKGYSDLFTISNLAKGESISPESERKIPIQITGIIANDELHVSFNYNRYQFEVEVITQLMDLFRENLLKIIQHCEEMTESEVTPSDLDDDDISLKDLEDLDDYLGSLEL